MQPLNQVWLHVVDGVFATANKNNINETQRSLSNELTLGLKPIESKPTSMREIGWLRIVINMLWLFNGGPKTIATRDERSGALTQSETR